MGSIGILQVFNDHTDGLGPSFQNDAERIVTLCRLAGRPHTFSTYDVGAGQYPKDMDEHSAYIISGSPASVNDNHIFTAWLESFVIKCDYKRKKLLGICFGHQMIAKALGGTVGPLQMSWNLGIRRSTIHRYLSFMEPRTDILAYALHNEEIKTIPSGFINLGSIENCQYAFLSKEDHIFSTQIHPEISDEFFTALLASDYNLRISFKEIEREKINPQIFSSWLNGFFSD